MINGGIRVVPGVVIVFAGFLLDWVSIIFGWKKFRPYAKVLALVLLIIWTLNSFNFLPGPLGWLLILALTFGLVGDILLLFPDRCFKWGLGAFLLGHFTYLGLFITLIGQGFEQNLISSISPWAWIGMGWVVAAAIVLFYRAVIQSMFEPRPWWLFQAVLYLYAICLTSVMGIAYLTAGLFAAEHWLIWALPVGGTLFFISDFALAFNRFVRPIRLAHLWIMMSYHLAQFFLAVGFITLISLF